MVFANKLINVILLGSLTLAIVACDREPGNSDTAQTKPNPYSGIIQLDTLALPEGNPAPGSHFSVQVGLYEDMKDAAPLIEALAMNNYQLMVHRVVDKQGNETNLLRVGEYDSLEEANNAAAEMNEVAGGSTKVILLPQ
jgi:cell division septation protein DedD